MCHHLQVEVICLCVNVSLLHQNQLPEVTCTVAAGHCACCLPLSRCQLAFPILHVFFDDPLSLAAVTFLTAAYTQISLEPQEKIQKMKFKSTLFLTCGFSRSIWFEFKKNWQYLLNIFHCFPFPLQASAASFQIHLYKPFPHVTFDTK